MSIRVLVTAGCAAAFCALTPGMAQAREAPSTVLHEQAAAAMLRSVGIHRVSSGRCGYRWDAHCTSLEGVRFGTVGGVLQLKEASGCPIVISGGTEVGHAPGPLSHGAGYKLDLVPNRCLDGYVKRHFRRVRVRGDGAAQYLTPTGTIFAREPSHWDVTFV